MPMNHPPMNAPLSVAPNRWAAPLILLLLGFVWGSSFILMKMGLFAQDGSALFPPTQLAALRMAIAGFTLLPIGLRQLLILRLLKLSLEHLKQAHYHLKGKKQLKEQP